MYKKLIFLLTLLAMLPFFKLSGQNYISTPYSGFGLGIMNYNVPGALQAMGGVSYSFQSNSFINPKNPASYVAFDSLSFIADAAFSIVNNKLTTTSEQQTGAYARLEYLTIGLPLTQHWRTSVGILPVSDLGFNIIDSDKDINGDAINYLYIGEGGLQQLYWGHAFKVAKGFSLGFNASYLFGSLSSSRFAEYEGDNYHNTAIREIIYIDGIQFSAGFQYHANIKEKHQIGIGAVYENTIHGWSRDNFIANSYRGSYFSPSIVDTIAIKMGADAVRGTMRIPQSVGGGLSYSYKEQLTFGVDFTWQNWKNYKNVSATQDPDTFSNNFITAVGFQYTPDPLSKKYLKRMSFRAGFRYSTGYIQYGGETVDEMVASVGLGFPLRTFNNKSAINILFEYKKMGNISLIKQEYMCVTFNFVLQERWYRRNKID